MATTQLSRVSVSLRPHFPMIGSLSSLLLLLLLAPPTGQPATAKSRFDGEWGVQLIPVKNSAPGQAAIKDKLVFKEGKFHSEHFLASGHAPREFEQHEEKLPHSYAGPTEMTTTEIVSESKTDGRLEWRFWFTQVHLQGSLRWTDPQGAVRRYEVIFDGFGDQGF